ncbi:hypothetical protein [Sphingomonas sp. ID0503]|uniref:hypothetical protein n=1 Tax=Sphingomonas sp. ID0503 TaxID=3399691 RepID=UPI003AFAE4D0
MIWPAALLLLAAPQAEDAAHRADRERTEQLNRQAAKIVERRQARNADAREDYRDADARYQRQMAAWRQRVVECRSGNWDACDDR